MRVKAVGRFLLVRTDVDVVNAALKGITIQLPPETRSQLEGGVQVHTILSMGPCAFDDWATEDVQAIKEGRQVVTSRYPGHLIDFDPLAPDGEVSKYRLISCDEVHAIIANEDEDGVNVGRT